MNNEEKVTKAIAEDEFLQWFKAKKLPNYLLEKNADDKEAIVNAIVDGMLSLNEENCFIQKLNFPVLMPSETISELKFAFRVPEGVLSASLKGIKTDDLIGQMALAYVSTLTGQTKSVIRALDPSDSYLGKKIAAFFFI
jgi:hypothetical protein